jgi:hypothetical protein
MEANITSINLWQTHVLSCPICGAAKDFQNLCQTAKNFWNPPEIPQKPVSQPVSQPIPQPLSQNPRPPWVSQNERMEDSYQEGDFQNPRGEVFAHSHERAVDHGSHDEHSADRGSVDCGSADCGSADRRPQVRRSCGQQSADRRSAALVLDASGLSSLASQVSERIMVKTSSGVSIAVPMEKTSSLISFSTAPGVILRMPERDITVYGEMKDVILRISQITEIMGAHVLFQGEMRQAAPGASQADVATTAIDVRRRTGLPIEPLDQVFGYFGDVASRVLRLGDSMGRLMTVDAETRRVIRSLRLLGIRMRGELERSFGGELVIDERSREVIQEARAVAIDLQGEIERRVGT